MDMLHLTSKREQLAGPNIVLALSYVYLNLDIPTQFLQNTIHAIDLLSTWVFFKDIWTWRINNFSLFPKLKVVFKEKQQYSLVFLTKLRFVPRWVQKG